MDNCSNMLNRARYGLPSREYQQAPRRIVKEFARPRYGLFFQTRNVELFDYGGLEGVKLAPFVISCYMVKDTSQD